MNVNVHGVWFRPRCKTVKLPFISNRHLSVWLHSAQCSDGLNTQWTASSHQPVSRSLNQPYNTDNVQRYVIGCSVCLDMEKYVIAQYLRQHRAAWTYNIHKFYILYNCSLIFSQVSLMFTHLCWLQSTSLFIST